VHFEVMKNVGWGGLAFLLVAAFVLVWLCVKFVKLVLWVLASESLGLVLKVSSISIQVPRK
jgi:hypothetical protein